MSYSIHHNPLEIHSSNTHHPINSSTSATIRNSEIDSIHENRKTISIGVNHHYPIEILMSNNSNNVSNNMMMVNNKFTNFQAFMMNGQARADLMHYLRLRENDENIVFVNEMFQMRESIRKVIRMFLYELKLTNHENLRKSTTTTIGTANSTENEETALSSLVSQLITIIDTIHRHYLLGNVVSGGIMLNTTSAILEKSKKDYSTFTRIFNKSPHTTATMEDHEILDTISRFCNYLLFEKDHKMHDKDLEKLKKILISDECTLETLSSQINFSEDLDELLKHELFAQLKWYPFRDLMNNIMNQIRLECFDSYKNTDDFENFVKKKIQELTSEQMYKLFCQNVDILEGTANENFVGDYVMSKKKKRRSLVDVILRRRPTEESEEQHSHHHHSDAEASQFLGLDPLNTDLREWFYPLPIPKWTSRHVIVFISHFCNYEDQDLEIYCKRIEKKNIVGLDLMSLLSVNSSTSTSMGSILSKDPSQHLFKEMKMKNHDHQQRFFNNLVDFNRKRTLMKRRSSINLLASNPINEKILPSTLQHQHVSVKDLYMPLVNEDHLIIKVISTGTDESRIFSIDRNIPLESLYSRIEDEFKNSKLIELMEGSLFELKSLYTEDGHAIRDQFHLVEYLSSKRLSSTLSTPRKQFPQEEVLPTDPNHLLVGSYNNRIIGSSYSKEDESILVDRASFEKSLGDVFGIENSVHDESEWIEKVEPFTNETILIPQEEMKPETKSTNDDGFKKLYIQPSCDRKFQRRSVVY